MNNPIPTSPTSSQARPSFIRNSLVIAGALCAFLRAEAQPVFSGEPTVPLVPAAIATAPKTSSAAKPSTGSTPIQFGTVAVHPRIYYQLLFSDGTLARPGVPASTTIQTISPGVQVNFGTHWILDYSPTQMYYSNPEFSDSTNQQVSLTGGAKYGSWQFAVAQNYNTSSQTLIQTGLQTNQKSYGTALTASYRFGERMSLDTVLNQQVQLVENQSGQPAALASPSTRNWFVVEQLNYIFTPRLSANVGMDFGYISVAPGPDITFTRPSAQIIWQPTDKISLDLEAGFENRKFQSGPAEDQRTPTFSSVLAYRPFENTKVSFYLVREMPTSYFVGQTTETTRWNIVLDQRLFKHLYLHTGYAEEDSDYSSDISNATTRVDKSYLYNARLNTTVFQRVSITALYQHRKLNSSDPNFRFASHYVGVEIAYRY